MYLSTVLDDFSRYIIAWKLCSNMRAEDVTDTLDMALQASGCLSATVKHKPRLLSDNGPSYIAGELAEYIEANNAKGSNHRLSNIGACNTASWPPNINPTDEANTPLIYAAISAKCSDDGQAR